MSSNPMDPLQALQAALAVPADSREQADLLAQLRENLEAHPNPIPILCTTLIKTVSGAGDSLLKRWVLELLHFAISRSSLSIETRTQLAAQSLDVLAGLLNDMNRNTVKIVVQCFGTVYPLLFRYLCTNRHLRPIWDTLTMSKTRILEFVWSPNASSGVKIAALKFMQRVILVQTRGVSDPRLQNKNDPNLSFCPADHPFISVQALEAEGAKLMEGVITIFYTSPNPDMMSAVVNSWGTLAKQRPSQTALIVSALASWSPGAISNHPVPVVRGVEKAVRILLVHLSRSVGSAAFAGQINDALAHQAIRMEQAMLNERNRKAAEAAEASRKRSITALNIEASEAKRMKTEHPNTSVTSILANFDFSSLPATLVTDLIVANLQVMTEQSLAIAIAAYRQANGTAPALAPRESPLPVASTSAVVPSAERQPGVKSEPLDPLQMDIEEEDIDYEPEKINAELSEGISVAAVAGEAEPIDIDEALRLVDFRMPPPPVIPDGLRGTLVSSSLTRIWNGGAELSAVAESAVYQSGIASPQDLSMLLLVRMVTRASSPDASDDEDENLDEKSVAVASRQERLRQVLFDYVMTDFAARERLAILWMNEEWYNDRLQLTANPDWYQNYPIWLLKLLRAHEPSVDAKDRTLSRFLLDIPHVLHEILEILRDLCTEPDRMQVGFTTLREFISQRLTLRVDAMKILLDLTTHPEKVTRGAAIITVKRWMPDVQPMSDLVRNFALRLLRRLQKPPSNSSSTQSQTEEHAASRNSPKPDGMAVDGSVVDGQVTDNGDIDAMEDGEMPQEEVVQTEYLPSEVELPAQNPQVLQHVELIFALCVKAPEFLDEIFDAYGQMDVSVQECIQDLITQLIRSLGPSHGRLLALLRTFPPGAESLALRVLTIFTENGRPSPTLVSLVKGLISERDLDARFLIPIIAEMDKADIMRHLPRIVSMLNGTPEAKALVKSVFESIVTTPPQTFGSVTSNLPRVRQSELLTPAELMVLLHESEKEIGLKSAIEAISVCFSMTDVFRSEILAVVMQQIVDEPVLPVLFLRTVIQAVTTYKSLVGFVSTTLLSRLITKKIWTNPPLWEGFIRCAKAIAPASFGALLQLPKDQLRELVDKQPGLKSGLRDFVLKKAGNKARQAGFLDLFGDDRSESPAAQPQALPTPTA